MNGVNLLKNILSNRYISRIIFEYVHTIHEILMCNINTMGFHNIILAKRYDQIIDPTWMLEHSFKQLLCYKIKRGDRIRFTQEALSNVLCSLYDADTWKQIVDNYGINGSNTLINDLKKSFRDGTFHQFIRIASQYGNIEAIKNIYPLFKRPGGPPMQFEIVPSTLEIYNYITDEKEINGVIEYGPNIKVTELLKFNSNNQNNNNNNNNDSNNTQSNQNNDKDNLLLKILDYAKKEGNLISFTSTNFNLLVDNYRVETLDVVLRTGKYQNYFYVSNKSIISYLRYLNSLMLKITRDQLSKVEYLLNNIYLVEDMFGNDIPTTIKWTLGELESEYLGGVEKGCVYYNYFLFLNCIVRAGLNNFLRIDIGHFIGMSAKLSIPMPLVISQLKRSRHSLRRVFNQFCRHGTIEQIDWFFSSDYKEEGVGDDYAFKFKFIAKDLFRTPASYTFNTAFYKYLFIQRDPDFVLKLFDTEHEEVVKMSRRMLGYYPENGRINFELSKQILWLQKQDNNNSSSKKLFDISMMLSDKEVRRHILSSVIISKDLEMLKYVIQNRDDVKMLKGYSRLVIEYWSHDTAVYLHSIGGVRFQRYIADYLTSYEHSREYFPRTYRHKIMSYIEDLPWILETMFTHTQDASKEKFINQNLNKLVVLAVISPSFTLSYLLVGTSSNLSKDFSGNLNCFCIKLLVYVFVGGCRAQLETIINLISSRGEKIPLLPKKGSDPVHLPMDFLKIWRYIGHSNDVYLFDLIYGLFKEGEYKVSRTDLDITLNTCLISAIFSGSIDVIKRLIQLYPDIVNDRYIANNLVIKNKEYQHYTIPLYTYFKSIGFDLVIGKLDELDQIPRLSLEQNSLSEYRRLNNNYFK